MGMRARGACVLAATAVLLLSACRPVGGDAEVINESGRDDLRLVVVDAQGRDRVSTEFDEVAPIDTQFMERELQCYIASDGHFEVRDSNGEVFARNDFADHQVCDGDIIVLGADGSLTWKSTD